MEIGTVFYPRTRDEWRAWLEENHDTLQEIWVRRFKKATGEPCITYDELVEECLCFGWIDGLVKKFDERSSVQRITPRRQKSFLSELNRQRVWKLQGNGRMTPAGLNALGDRLGAPDDPWDIPDWIEERLREDPEVWERFNAFPHLYRRLKIGWITEAGQLRQDEMDKRLAYLIKNTKKGKIYGTVPISDALS